MRPSSRRTKMSSPRASIGPPTFGNIVCARRKRARVVLGVLGEQGAEDFTASRRVRLMPHGDILIDESADLFLVHDRLSGPVMTTLPTDLPGYGMMRTTGASLKLPELATNRLAVGARRRPAPPEVAGSLVTDTAEPPHADAEGESVTWTPLKTQPDSRDAIIRLLRVLVVMVWMLHALIWSPPACRRSGR
jgi:hypothetical protein